MNKKQNIRIIDIAKMAKVSVGTVDRVLHKRGRVSDEKREKVEKVLKEINYEPNMVARFLASKKSFSFAVLIPSYEMGEYWELVSSGIEKAVNELRDFSVSIDYLFFDQFDSKSFVNASKQFEMSGYAGVIIATLHKENVIKLSQQLDKKEIPYVYIDSNIPDCKNLSYFGSDSFASGAIAAKLMLTKIGSDGNIIITHADYSEGIYSTQIENRERGFLDYLTQNKFEGKIMNFTFNPSKKVEGIKQLDSLIETGMKTGAIMFNSRIYEIVSLVDSLTDKSKKIKLIGYDPIEKNVAALKNDKIAYLISQRSILQGYDCIKALSNHLIFNAHATKDNYMPIDILIKENVVFYND